MVGKAKVMSYEDIVEATRKREEKDAAKGTGRGRKGRKPLSAPRKGKESREEEIEQTHRELEREGPSFDFAHGLLHLPTHLRSYTSFLASMAHVDRVHSQETCPLLGYI